jgi:hypothetical protein
VELAGGADEVEQLRLGHRDGDLQELRRVVVREAVHERVEGGDDLFDGVGVRCLADGSLSFVWG